MKTLKDVLRIIFTFRWKPGLDVLVVLLSSALVTASLYTAMIIITPAPGGGMPYFFMYAGVTAFFLGTGIPLAWMVFYRKRGLESLGITKKYLGLSLLLQFAFSVVQFALTLARMDLPPVQRFLPLLAMSLAIGFFEALFWRGWVLQRLEEAFGLLPAIVIGSALYAAYHIGYGMPLKEILFLFWIGVLYAVCFRLTKSIFILWPAFQPLGQMVTLVRDGLELPLIASLGFIEALVLILALVWLAHKYHTKRSAKEQAKLTAA